MDNLITYDQTFLSLKKKKKKKKDTVEVIVAI